MFLEQPSVAAWVVPPSFSCKMSFLSIFCNFLQGDTAYVKTFFVKLSTYHPKCQNLLAIHKALRFSSKTLLMLQGGMVSLGWSVKDDRNLEVFVGFLMGSPRILTLATMIHDFSLNRKRVSLLKSNDFFMTEISGKRQQQLEESQNQSFRDLQECIL